MQRIWELIINQSIRIRRYGDYPYNKRQIEIYLYWDDDHYKYIYINL